MVGRELVIIIPCHNEELTIGRIVRAACLHGDVLVVDDKSTDASANVARVHGARVIASTAPGYDGAITTGLRYSTEAGYKYMITMDADGEHDPALIGAFKTAFANGISLVCGYRPKPQRIAEYLISLYGYFRFGVYDLLCGMKGYSRRVALDYLECGRPLFINMTPTVLWRRCGGAFAQIAVSGERRIDRPRFGRRFSSNIAILRALLQISMSR